MGCERSLVAGGFPTVERASPAPAACGSNAGYARAGRLAVVLANAFGITIFDIVHRAIDHVARIEVDDLIVFVKLTCVFFGKEHDFAVVGAFIIIVGIGISTPRYATLNEDANTVVFRAVPLGDRAVFIAIVGFFACARLDIRFIARIPKDNRTAARARSRCAGFPIRTCCLVYPCAACAKLRNARSAALFCAVGAARSTNALACRAGLFTGTCCLVCPSAVSAKLRNARSAALFCAVGAARFTHALACCAGLTIRTCCLVCPRAVSAKLGNTRSVALFRTIGASRRYVDALA